MTAREPAASDGTFLRDGESLIRDVDAPPIISTRRAPAVLVVVDADVPAGAIGYFLDYNTRIPRRHYAQPREIVSPIVWQRSSLPMVPLDGLGESITLGGGQIERHELPFVGVANGTADGAEIPDHGRLDAWYVTSPECVLPPDTSCNSEQNWTSLAWEGSHGART